MRCAAPRRTSNREDPDWAGPGRDLFVRSPAPQRRAGDFPDPASAIARIRSPRSHPHCQALTADRTSVRAPADTAHRLPILSLFPHNLSRSVAGTVHRSLLLAIFSHGCSLPLPCAVVPRSHSTEPPPPSWQSKNSDPALQELMRQDLRSIASADDHSTALAFSISLQEGNESESTPTHSPERWSLKNPGNPYF